MKIYDLVKNLLTDYPELRDDDRKLHWRVWEKLGFVNSYNNDVFDNGYMITEDSYLEATSTETIRRCRQKIQELHPDLQSSKWMKKQREAIEKQRGTHIFREEIKEQMGLI